MPSGDKAIDDACGESEARHGEDEEEEGGGGGCGEGGCNFKADS